MGRSIFAHLVILQALGLAVVAWAGTDRADRGDRATASLARIEAREQSRVDIRGTLSCPMPEQNTGRSCTLQIVSEETGQTLKIRDSNAAMRLFQDGKTQVIASGVITGDALRVIAISTD